MKKRTIITAGVISAIVGWYWRKSKRAKPAQTLTELSAKARRELPDFCYTMTGQKTEPINLVIIGTEAQIRAAFTKAGWTEADPTTPLNLAKALLAAIFNLNYPHWPMTPYAINGEVQALSLQKGLEGGNHRGRHHLRIWSTNVTLEPKRPVWVSAASSESGVKLTSRPLFITHRMDAALDEERDFVAADLVKAGATLHKSLELSGVHQGQNVFGDPYHTDGQAAVLEVS